MAPSLITISRWIAEGEDCAKVFAALQPFPRESLAPNLAYYKAKCLNLLAMLDQDPTQAMQALDLLVNCEPKNPDHEYLSQLAKAYYLCWARSAALHYLKILDSQIPGQYQISLMMDRCRSFLRKPVISWCLRIRVEESWAAFAQESPDMLKKVKLWQRNHSSDLSLEIQNWIRQKVTDAIVECHALLVPFPDDAPAHVILRPSYSLINFYLSYCFALRMPDSLKSDWTFRVGLPQAFPGVSLITRLTVSDTQAWVEKTGTGTVRLSLFSHALSQDTDPDYLRDLVAYVLGDPTSLILVEKISVLSKPAQGPGIPLAHLDPALQDMGFCPPEDARDLVESYLLRWERTPDPEQEHLLREDIVSCTTRFPDLGREFRSRRHPTLDLLNIAGVSAGFLYFPASGSVSEDFLLGERLSADVSRMAGNDCILPMGVSVGTHNVYVDFLALDLEPILEAATLCFQKGSFAWGAFHTFCAEADLLLLHQSGDAAPPPDDPSSWKKDQTPGAPRVRGVGPVRKKKKKKR